MQLIIYRHPAPSKWSATSELRIRYTCHPVPRKRNMLTRQKAAHHHTTHNNVTWHQAKAHHHKIHNNNNGMRHMGAAHYYDLHYTLAPVSCSSSIAPEKGLYKEGLPPTSDTSSSLKDLYAFLSAYLRFLWQRRGLRLQT